MTDLTTLVRDVLLGNILITPLQLTVLGAVVVVVVSLWYLVWSYRPPRPDLVNYSYGGTHCEIEWSCTQDQEQYKCHLLPSVLAQKLPIKHYLVQMWVEAGPWRTVGVVMAGDRQKYRVEDLTIGSRVQFRVLTINILARRSFPSDVSQPYNVVGE